MKTRLESLAKNSTQLFGDSSSECEKSGPDLLSSASTNSSVQTRKWKRNRKNCEQVQVLLDEYNINPHWSKESVTELAEKTGLSEAQVYKWGWDYKKKLKKQALKVNFRVFLCCEIIAPSKIDLEMDDLQRSYKNLASYSGGFGSSQIFY